MKSLFGKYFYLVLIVGLMMSCAKKNVVIPPDVIPVKQMIEVLTDVHLAEAAKDVAMPTDTSKHTIDVYYTFIFKKYNLTKEKFQKSLNFYKSNPELMEEMYAEVINRLSELQAKPGNH